MSVLLRIWVRWRSDASFNAASNRSDNCTSSLLYDGAVGSADEPKSLARAAVASERVTDGQSLWFTRIDASDPRAFSPGEGAYGRWIPGDPWKTLRAIFVFAPADVITSVVTSAQN